MSSAKWRPFCPSLNVLTDHFQDVSVDRGLVQYMYNVAYTYVNRIFNILTMFKCVKVFETVS